MNKEQFCIWATSVCSSNDLMQYDGKYGLSPNPSVVAQHDAKAAELLKKAKDAHNTLTAHLRACFR